MLQVNEYFDGKVKSITLYEGERRCTLGVMEPGEYEFGTSQHETITVLVGTMEVKLPGDADYTPHDAGATFSVPANIKFNVRMASQAGYRCFYD